MIRPADDKGFSVLLVENDEAIFHLLRKSLEENAQFSSVVDRAASVGEAFTKLKKKQYHIILVESELDNESGLSLLDRIQASKMEIPFVLMTPVRDDRFAREAIKKGVADLIVKNESHFQELSDKL